MTVCTLRTCRREYTKCKSSVSSCNDQIYLNQISLRNNSHVSIVFINSNWINSNHDIKFTVGVTGFLIPPFQGTFTMIRNGTVYSLINGIFRGCNTVSRFFQAPSDTDRTDETVKNFMAYFTKAVQLPFY